MKPVKTLKLSQLSTEVIEDEQSYEAISDTFMKSDRHCVHTCAAQRSIDDTLPSTDSHLIDTYHSSSANLDSHNIDTYHRSSANPDIHNIDTCHRSSANLATDRRTIPSHTDSVHNACNPESSNDNSSSTNDSVNSETIDWLQVLEVDPAWMIP